ncbi:MAG: NUDIX hydrolase [Lachnospiraceae bacterium]|nr:NUDIX hydrolase [Lachnospiraceae bacterium]
MIYDKREDLKWEEVKVDHVISDEWMDLRKSRFRFPDGKEFEPYYSYSRRSFVVVVARDTEGKFLCVRQFRYGIKKVTTEFTAGGLERGDGREYAFGDSIEDYEDALSAAKRELLEETGYASVEWTHIITVPSNATIADNYAFIYFADNCRKVAEQSLDETEYLNVELHSAEEIEELIRQGNFEQANHILAWYMLKDRNLL